MACLLSCLEVDMLGVLSWCAQEIERERKLSKLIDIAVRIIECHGLKFDLREYKFAAVITVDGSSIPIIITERSSESELLVHVNKVVSPLLPHH